MDKETLQKMHAEQGAQKIKKLKRSIDTTRHNIEIAQEIIANTPSDAQRDKLIERNSRRLHAVGSQQKQIRDLEQTIEARGKEG